MKRALHFILILGIVLYTITLITSCREDSDMVLSYAYDSPNTSNFDEASASFEGQFKAFWTAMNCNYPIWDYEEQFGMDWDKVYDEYLPKFRALDERARVQHDSVTNDELGNLYRDIIRPLHDGHFAINIKNLHAYTPNNLLYNVNDSLSPSIIRNKSCRRDYNDIETSLDFYCKSRQIVEHKKSYKCEYAYFSDQILYLRIKDFKLSDSLADSSGNNQLRTIWLSWFNKVQELDEKSNLKGVIIDIRNNGGGYANDYQYALGALQTSDYGDNKVHSTGYLRIKTGVGRLDYSPLIPLYLPLYQNHHAIISKQPIVILANCNTKSTAEHTCIGAKQLKNGYVIGTQTWGALAPLNKGDYSETYAGIVGDPFLAPFYLYIPSAAFFTLDGEILESIGVTPDIEIELDNELYKNTGRDNQLERALEFIRTGK